MHQGYNYVKFTNVEDIAITMTLKETKKGYKIWTLKETKKG